MQSYQINITKKEVVLKDFILNNKSIISNVNNVIPNNKWLQNNKTYIKNGIDANKVRKISSRNESL